MTGRILIDELDLERARREKDQKPKRADRMTAFLYTLIRDRMTMGEIEEILDDLGTDDYCILQNRRIVEYAEWLKKTILKEPEFDSPPGLCKCMQKLESLGLIEYNGTGEWLFLHRETLSSSITYKPLGPCPICGKSYA